MIALASIDAIERLLMNQTGFALGFLAGGVVMIAIQKYYIKAWFEEAKEDRDATNRLCRVVASLLLDSEIKSTKQKGMDTLSELNAAETKKP